MAVNGFQLPGLRFVSLAGGLVGFQRQGMDQRKKGGAVAVPFTFNPARTGVGALLSLGDTVAAYASGSLPVAHSLQVLGIGKTATVQLLGVSGGGYPIVGFCNGSAPILGTSPNSTADGGGVNSAGGAFIQGAGAAAFSATTAGDFISITNIDPTNVSFSKNGEGTVVYAHSIVGPLFVFVTLNAGPDSYKLISLV